MSTEKLQLYKCEICGNLVQVILNGAGELVCCGQPMKLQIPQHDKTEIGEKHAPKTEFRDNKKLIPPFRAAFIILQNILSHMLIYPSANRK